MELFRKENYNIIIISFCKDFFTIFI